MKSISQVALVFLALSSELYAQPNPEEARRSLSTSASHSVIQAFRAADVPVTYQGREGATWAFDLLTCIADANLGADAPLLHCRATQQNVAVDFDDNTSKSLITALVEDNVPYTFQGREGGEWELADFVCETDLNLAGDHEIHVCSFKN